MGHTLDNPFLSNQKYNKNWQNSKNYCCKYYIVSC